MRWRSTASGWRTWARAEEPESLGAGSVRVAIKAVSLNHRDVLVCAGRTAPERSKCP